MSHRKICILGAGGSIGSRLLTILLSHGYEVTAVVRSLSSAVRIGRFDVPIVAMDLLTSTADDLAGVIEKHDVVIDCTYSGNNDYDQRLTESRQLAELICCAMRQSNVSRLIHYGTISVYPIAGGLVDESTECCMRGDSYADSKLVAERIFLSESSSQLAITVLQLPVVFGAFMGWSTSPVTQMSGQCLLMPDSIKGYCSPLFVDDVAAATILAFECEESYGERILLSDEPISWQTYYRAYACLSDQLNVRLVDRSQVHQLQEQQAFATKPLQILKSKFSNDGDFRQMILAQWGIRSLYAWLKRYRGQESVDKIKSKLATSVESSSSRTEVVIDKGVLELFDGMPRVNASKSRTLLKFDTYTHFSDAMIKTGEWLKWARLIT